MPYYGNEPADVAVTVGADVITTTQIQDATIATADIANDAITATKVDDDGTGFQMGSLGIGTAVSGSHKLTVGGTATFSGDITGTLATASQSNITSVGTLTSLTAGTTTITGLTHLKGSAWNSILRLGDTSRSEQLTHMNNGSVNFSIYTSNGTKGVITANHDGSAMTLGADYGSGTLTVTPPSTFTGNAEFNGTVLVSGTSDSPLSLRNTSGGEMFLKFLNTNGTINGAIISNNSANTMSFRAGGNTFLSIDNSSNSTFTGNMTIDGVGHPVLKLVGDASAGESTHLQLHRSNGHGFTIYDTGSALAFRSDTSSNDQMLQLANSDQSATFYGDVTISKSSAKMTIFASNTGDHESLVFDRNTASNGDSQEIRWKLQGDTYKGGYILHEFADANNSTMAFGTRNSGTPTTAMSIDQNTRVSLAKLPYRVNTSQQNQTNLMSCFHWDHPNTTDTSFFDFNPVLDLGLKQSGGSFLLKISGWQDDRFLGMVTYRASGGGGANINSGAIHLDTIINDGYTISVSSPSGNLVRIQLSGHHNNDYGWDMMAFSAPFVT